MANGVFHLCDVKHISQTVDLKQAYVKEMVANALCLALQASFWTSSELRQLSIYMFIPKVMIKT